MTFKSDMRSFWTGHLEARAKIPRAYIAKFAPRELVSPFSSTVGAHRDLSWDVQGRGLFILDTKV